MKDMELFGESVLCSLESKDRSKKVMITEEAINKVPYIEYKNIDETEYKNIQYLAKKVLQLSKDNNNSNEVAITYGLAVMEMLSEDSDYVGIAFGNEHDVKPLSDTKSSLLIHGYKRCAVVLLHNHPSLSLISLEDIRFFLEHWGIQLMVIVSNLGAISYISKSRTFNSYKAIELLNDCITKNNMATDLKGKADAVKYFIQNCHSVGIDYDDR